MKFRLPDADELKTLARDMGRPLDDAAARALLGYMGPFSATYAYLDAQSDVLPPVKYPERSHHFPASHENALGGWYVKTDLKGNPAGPLAGKRVAIKDNIFVAGVPMANGSSLLQGFVPDFDATVVTRLLDAGAEIAGKAVCEYLCVSGGSATAVSGFVRNPRNPAYSAGGSSSGSAALVGGGEADMSLGCDQAGSVRIPSSWCGTVGMKATHGLIPYTGIMGMEATLDYVGPITKNVADNALLLEVLAGYDGIDSRQRLLQVHRYSEALGRPVPGMKIGVLKQGFAHPLCAPEVAECVRAALARLADLGAQVEDVDIPMHTDGVSIWGGVITEGLWHNLNRNGIGINIETIYSPALIDALQGWRGKLGETPINIQIILLLGKHLERYGNRYYAKAKNLVPRLRKAYDDALGRYDLLALPTMLQPPSKLPDSPAELTDEHILSDAFPTILNTCQFDICGQPAMTVPCGLRNGLPVGMMLVARHFHEPEIYRAAHAFEQSGDWQSM